MILGILQARVSSSRLAGKVLKPILGKPMIIHQIERLKRSRVLDGLVVATSADAADDALARLCGRQGVEVYRGALDDVLDRFYRAAAKYRPAHIVRLTGDCPLIDWRIMDDVIRLHGAAKNDYTCNTLPPTYPDGLDVEVCTAEALREAWRLAALRSEREHVTLYIRNRPERFRLGCLTNPQDLSQLRWTVDEAEDFELATRIYQHLYEANADFSLPDILELLRRKPTLREINKKYHRNEGLEKSLRQDAEPCGKEG